MRMIRSDCEDRDGILRGVEGGGKRERESEGRRESGAETILKT